MRTCSGEWTDRTSAGIKGVAAGEKGGDPGWRSVACGRGVGLDKTASEVHNAVYSVLPHQLSHACNPAALLPLPACLPSCRSQELESSSLQRDLAAALELVLNHKMQVQARVKATHSRMQRLQAELLAMPSPVAAA